jgi:NAD-dependent dihydropyrimidine dehydrogenase PreA subunit
MAHPCGAPVEFHLLFSAICQRRPLARELQLSGDMAYVITDTCTKDELCVQACPVDCIHPKQDEDGFAETPQLYVNPADCIDCGACIPVCPTNSIYTLDELPVESARFAELNAAHYN